jgi:hypothetical protein
MSSHWPGGICGARRIISRSDITRRGGAPGAAGTLARGR